MQPIHCFQFSRVTSKTLGNSISKSIGIQKPAGLINPSTGKSRPLCSPNGFKMNPDQLFDNHLVVNRRLLETRLKIKMHKLAQSLANQWDLKPRSHLLQCFLTSISMFNSRIFIFPQLFIILLTLHHVRSFTKILCDDDDIDNDDDDVKRKFVLYPSVSRCPIKLCCK